MLTQSEREWLEHRDAMQFITGTYIADFAEYPLWNSGKDWQDAAEFSERVAAKLAEMAHWLAHGIGTEMECVDLCDASKICEESESLPCQWCFLKHARLAVEEEIDGLDA